MSTIIAGLFDNIDRGNDAAESLRRHHFAESNVWHFANNPPGQHDQLPLGGDENADPGAMHGHTGAATGAGAVVAGVPGAAVGDGVGEHVVSLVGALVMLEGKGSEQCPVRRRAGVMVAAQVDSAAQEQIAILVLNAEGAMHVEKAQGQWSGGRWTDFDPVVEPRLVVVPHLPAGSATSTRAAQTDVGRIV